nr:MAG TPA: hypothetical protein [Caudoviricetes sp.]
MPRSTSFIFIYFLGIFLLIQHRKRYRKSPVKSRFLEITGFVHYCRWRDLNPFKKPYICLYYCISLISWQIRGKFSDIHKNGSRSRLREPFLYYM